MALTGSDVREAQKTASRPISLKAGRERIAPEPDRNQPRRTPMPAGKRRAASLWALVAGVALAGAVSSSLSPEGRDRIASMLLLDNDPTQRIAVLEPSQRNQPEMTLSLPPMVTGSIETSDAADASSSAMEDMPSTAMPDVADLSAEVARLKSENRLLKIERDALRGRLQQPSMPMATVPAQSRQPMPSSTITVPGMASGFDGQEMTTEAFSRAAAPNITMTGTAATRTPPPQSLTPLEPALSPTPGPTPGIVINTRALNPGEIALSESPVGATEGRIQSALAQALQMDAVQDEALLPVNGTEFAIDIGTADTMEGLRNRWQSFVSAYPELSDLLSPAMRVEENGDGAMRLRLIAGPLQNAADAVGLCAQLRDNGVLCSTSVFDGQRLASQ